MPSLRITLIDPLETFPPYGKIFHRIQTKKGYIGQSAPHQYEVEFELDNGIPKGEIVHYNSDKRRFIYIQWTGENGQQFRRIKLFFEHFLQDGVEHYNVRIPGKGKDGTPSCATTRPIP